MSDFDNRLKEFLLNRQLQATDPRHSAWAAAHAGSGKTTLLVQRYLRLLLQGYLPDNILCLTFTRTAAAVMLERVHDEIQKWMAMQDDELQEQLEKILDKKNIDHKVMQTARLLFGQIIDMPKGLKIQTIHSFAESILRFFPIETDISPSFRVIDEWQAEQMINKAIQIVINGRAANIADCYDTLIANEINLTEVIRVSLMPTEKFGQQQDDITGFFKNFYASHYPGFDIEMSEMEFYNYAEQKLMLSSQEWQKIIEKLHKNLSYQKELKKITELCETNSIAGKIDIFAEIMLNADKKPRKIGFVRWLAKEDKNFAHLPQICATILQQHNAIKQFQICYACNRLAMKCQQEYQKLKANANFVDYDDLIIKLHGFLLQSDSKSALHKHGIVFEHLLIDEAQDNSTLQWQIVDRLNSHFNVAKSESLGKFTSIFVVGDYKQSIFSFQGAEPDAFLKWQKKFDKVISEKNKLLQKVKLDFSFRGAQFLLDIVDTVFQGQFPDFDHKPLKHMAYQKPARIEIWPICKGEKTHEEKSLFLSQQYQQSDQDSAYLLADQISCTIEQWFEKGLPKPFENDEPKQMEILILLRRRTQLMEKISKALQKRNINVAGVDSTMLQNELPVMDLINLARWALNPLDELALAILLKSSFFNFSEEQLMQICIERQQNLWHTMGQEPMQCQKIKQTYQQLKPLLHKVNQLNPYEFFIDWLYGQQQIIKLNEKFGNFALDAVQLMLEKAYQHTNKETSSMYGFLDEVNNNQTPVKNEIQQKQTKIKLMSIHAAKGTEADIIILPDAHSDILPFKAKPVKFKHETKKNEQKSYLLHTMGKNNQTPLDQSITQNRCQQEKNEAQRLLYVAMTRAKHMLIICGHGSRKISSDCFYARICKALELETNDKGSLVQKYCRTTD